MIIKNYNACDDLQIIENVNDIQISKGEYQIPDKVESFSDFNIGPQRDLIIAIPFEYFRTPKLGSSHINVRIVDYKKSGEDFYRRLLVGNIAYICNDQGKTIEKVSVSDQIPV